MRSIRSGIVCILVALGACVFTDDASTPPVAEGNSALGITRLITEIHSGLVPGTGRYFHPGSGNYKRDDGSACSGTGCRYTGPRTPGGADTQIVRFRDGVLKTSGTCGSSVVPEMTILALQPRRNGTAQTRLNAHGQTVAPGALFEDGTYEWLIAQVCTSAAPHPGEVSTWYDVKSCSTVDDTDPASNDNNISTWTTNPDTQLGACQSVPIIDHLVKYSMSYDDTSLTACPSTSPGPDPASFKTLRLNLTGDGAGSPNAGVTTNIPAAPMVSSGTQLACPGAAIHVTPWDADACDGIEFAGWDGACSGVGDCTVTMTRNTTVVASFTAHDCGPDQVWDPSACGCVAGE